MKDLARLYAERSDADRGAGHREWITHGNAKVG
jgi:hypothetical protein